jgi:hypothetical protein
MRWWLGRSKGTFDGSATFPRREGRRHGKYCYSHGKGAHLKVASTSSTAKYKFGSEFNYARLKSKSRRPLQIQ